MKNQVIALMIALVPLAGLNAQTTSERTVPVTPAAPATLVIQTDPTTNLLREQVDQLKAQVRQQRIQTREARELTASQQAVIRQERELAEKHAAALREQQAVVAMQSETIAKQSIIETQRTNSLMAMQQSLYVVGGIVVLVAIICFGVAFAFRKRKLVSEKPSGKLYTLVPASDRNTETSEVPTSSLPSVASRAPKILPDSLVNPSWKKLMEIMGDKGVSQVAYMYQLQGGATFSCLGVKKSEQGPPLTRFVDYPEIPDVKWDARAGTAIDLLRGEAKVS